MRTKILLMILIILVCGCSIDTPSTSDMGVGYTYIEVSGMPCFRVSRTIGNKIWAYDGVTCDWSKWNSLKYHSNGVYYNEPR